MTDAFDSLPKSEFSSPETDKTKKTDFGYVSNEDYINGLFGEINGVERPVVVSFSGNPNTVSRNTWFGSPWVTGKTILPANHNNYLTFASYRPDDEGKYRRKKLNFAALYAVMLDDVGVKVPIDRINLQPSWKIETSKDNFQLGFILAEPLRVAAEADRLLTAIIDAGLCDPGASGPCARLGRLPVGMNGKHLDDHHQPWLCQLIDWQPELRYTIEELANGLEIDLSNNSHQTRQNGRRQSAQSIEFDHDDVHIPRANENPVIAALKRSGLYKQPLGDNKHDITCPWVNEHTDRTDHGTAYFEPSEYYPLGGFKCLHGHCAKRRVSTLHEFLGVSRVEAKHKPMIFVRAGELPGICDAAELELAKTLRHYQRGGIIVTVSTDPATRDTSVKALSLPSLTRVLAGLVVWQRFDKRSDQWLISDPPEKHARVLYDATIYPHLPELNGIARQPYLRPNGSLMVESGYDAATGMFGVFDARQFNILATPNRQQAENALAALVDLLFEFPFKNGHDQAAALAGILTAVVRPSLPLAPMIHIKAPSIASGKSYLCELLTAFATPQKGTPFAFPADDEECRKLILAELLTAPAVLEFDNLTGDLIPHKSLCTALTSEFISGRILGQSKTAEVGTRVLFLSSGNNVEPVRDMTRRTITITLDPVCELPAARVFRRQPVSEVKAERGHFISLAMTIVRAWIVAGRPYTECKGIASYSEWSHYCRQPLLWLGLPDPAACIFNAINDDPDRELLGELLTAWDSRFGKAPILVKDVINAALERGIKCNLLNETLSEAITDIAGERDGMINRKRLGWWIKRHAGRVVNGLRFVQDNTTTSNAAKWKVESVLSV